MSSDQLAQALLAVAVSLGVIGCKLTRQDVREKLEAQGYTNVVVDSADNEHGVFHWTGQKPFETCRGTLLDRDDRLMSTTCWERERPLASARFPGPLPSSSASIEQRDSGDSEK